MAQETPEPAPSTGIPSVVGPLPPLQLAPPQLAPPELAPPRIPTSQLPPLQIGPSSQIELKRWNEIPRSGIVLDAGPREAMESAEPASPFQAAQRSVPAPFRSRIPNGLPDLPSSETSLFRSRLVSSDPDSYSDPDIGSRGGTNDEGALDEGKSEGITDRAKKLTKQLVAMEQRLVRTFPQDYLLDALDPGLFGTEEAPWLPAPQLRVNNVPARLVATAEAAWAALHPELTERLKRADGFLRQRSIYSAREEIRAGLTALSRKLDQLANTENESSGSQRKLAIRKSMPHESSLQHAFRALDECGFVPQIGRAHV